MSISTADLAGALWSLGGFLLVIAGVVTTTALAIWIARRRGRNTGVIDAVLVLSGALVAFVVIAMPFAILQTMTADSVTVWNLPVSMPWPEELPCGQPATATGTYLECASTGSTIATIVGLPPGTRALLAGGQLLGGLLTAAPIAAIGIICFQVLRGASFARVTSRTLLWTAGVVLVAAIAGDLLTGIGRGLAALEVFPSNATPGVSGPTATYDLAIQPWPFAAALALTALAMVFRYGTHLQRDTEGLV